MELYTTKFQNRYFTRNKQLTFYVMNEALQEKFVAAYARFLHNVVNGDKVVN